MSSTTDILNNVNPSPVVVDKPTITKSSDSPWSKAPAQPIIYSLEDVMSEQLAKDLQEKEQKKHNFEQFEQFQEAAADAETLTEEQAAEILAKSETSTFDSDFMLAQLLQLEYDKEYDTLLKLHEDHKNKNSAGNFIL